MAFKRIKKWLERMAEENEKRYGNQKLDCCDMNRQSLSQGSHTHKHTASEKRQAC
ncbi:MAG: hypothetical protein Kow0042_01690 [Calditrichia bacterium]